MIIPPVYVTATQDMKEEHVSAPYVPITVIAEAYALPSKTLYTETPRNSQRALRINTMHGMPQSKWAASVIKATAVQTVLSRNVQAERTCYCRSGRMKDANVEDAVFVIQSQAIVSASLVIMELHVNFNRLCVKNVYKMS